MTVASFEDLFIAELSDLYNAEKQMTKALPKLAAAASNAELKALFTVHLKETEAQIHRIDELCEAEGLTLKPKKCAAMEGLIEEADEAIEDIEPGPLLDVALIVGAQKVEHYEIAGYGSLIELAKLLDYNEAVSFLEDTLDEEKGADEKLSEIAVGTVNEEAQEYRDSLV